MSDDEDISNLIVRAKRGSGDAAQEIVLRWGPLVQRVAKAKLSDPVVRQRVDEEDICQTVMSMFFSGLHSGRFILESADDMERLLTNITRKQVLKQIERHHALKRDTRKQSDVGEQFFDPMGNESTASVKVSREEMIGRFLDQLTDSEKEIIEQRRLGKTWEELGERYNVSSDALRVRIGRLTKVAYEQLGLQLSD